MKKMAGVLVMSVAVLFAVNVWAVPTLWLSDGVNNVYVSDGGIGDANQALGVHSPP